MLETSKDLLNVALTACIIVFTFFLCWGLYFLVMILKRVHASVKHATDLIIAIKEKIERLETLFKKIEEKLNHTASYLPLVLKGLTELIDYFKKKKQTRSSNRSKKQTSQ